MGRRLEEWGGGPARQGGRRSPGAGGHGWLVPEVAEDLLARLDDIVIVLDGELRSAWLNRQALAHFGLPEGEVLGRALWDTLPALRGTELETACRRALWERRTVRFEARGPVSGRWLDVRVIPAEAGLLVRASDVGERHAMEVALRERDADARASWELAHVPKVRIDPQTRCFVAANAAFCELTGYTEEELRRLGPRDLTHPEDWPADAPSVDALLRGDRAQYTAEKRYVRKDGRIVVVEVHGTLIRDSDGQPRHVTAVVHDVTARHEAQAALRRSEELFRTLTDLVPEIVWIAGPDGEVEFYNRRWEEFSGVPRESGAGWGWHPVVHPDDQALTEAAWRRAVQTGVPYEIEHRVRRANGSWCWLLSRALPLRDEQGRIVKWFGTAADIDRQKRAEAALRESHRQLEEAQQIARVGSWRYDPATGSVERSAEVLRIMGVPGAPGTLSDLLSRVAPADAEAVASAIQRAVTSGEPLAIRHRLVRPDGAVRIVDRRARCVDTDEGPRLVGTVQDVTDAVRAEEERRALEAQVQRAQRVESMTVLAGGVAHDFNNLLVAVLGHADLALWDLPRDSPARGSLEEIRKAGERARELARKMLAFSGRGRFIVAPADLSRVVRSREKELRGLLPPDATLELALADDLPPVPIDASQLHQLLSELVTNASEALEPGQRRVTIRTALLDAPPPELARGPDADVLPPGARVVALEVADTGSGMPPELCARAFDPFVSTKFAGRGLGLSAVLGIARGHGGAVTLDSGAGRGTRARVLFPVPQDEVREPTPPPAPSGPSEAVKVLVVDDDKAVREVLKVGLTRKGFQVLLAANGREGLECLRSNLDSVGVVLLDVVMPVMDGESAFREMHRLRPDLPVLLMSGYSDREAIARLTQEGIAGFVPKPFEFAHLVVRLREVARVPAGQVPAPG